MHPTLKTLAGAAASALLALAAPAALAQGKGETVKFQDYPGTGNTLIRVAIAKGYCTKYGITCQLQTIPTSPLGVQAMMAKSIDSALAPVDAVNQAVLRGAKMKMVAGGQVNSIILLAFGNHVETPNLAKGWPHFMQDLKGKKVGIPARGSQIEIIVSWMMEQAGMDPTKDVSFVAVGGVPTTYGSLQSKQVDAVFSYDPVGTICDLAKTCKVAWRADSAPDPAPIRATNGGVVNQVFLQEYIDKNPHVIDAVIRATQDAEAFVNDPANFDEVLKITQNHFKLEMPQGDAILAANLKHYIATKNFRAAIDRKAVQASLDLSLATKAIDKVATVQDIVYDRAP